MPPSNSASLQKIMSDHLLPAGYEFQKVLDDYERLHNGKELFDRGALKALAECTDNNARYELLERFRDYVLPNYDASARRLSGRQRTSLSPP